MDIETAYEETKTQSYLRTIAFVILAFLGPILAYAVNESVAEKAELEALHYQEERAQPVVCLDEKPIQL